MTARGAGERVIYVMVGIGEGRKRTEELNLTPNMSHFVDGIELHKLYKTGYGEDKDEAS